MAVSVREILDAVAGLIGPTDRFTTINDQDNRGTAFPMYVVQTKKRVDCVDPNYDCYDDYYWLNGEWDYFEVHRDQELWPELEEMYDSGAIQVVHYEEEETELTEDAWDRVFFRWRWEPVQWFFTEKAAEEFIERQRHNLKGEVRIYAESAHNNDELKAVQEFLRKIVEIALREA